MALALENGFAKRLALRILSHLGGSPFKILWFYVGICFFIHVDV
jgi:di/tricarboxylate transporter